MKTKPDDFIELSGDSKKPKAGLTKREYFAAMALQGYAQRRVEEGKVAQWSVEAADALIAELNKKQEG